jgi:membrane fusion protein, multidrug efflux system
MEQNENKNVETAEATQVSHEETRKKLKKQRVRQIIASLIGVAILAFGLWKIVCLFLDYNSNETSMILNTVTLPNFDIVIGNLGIGYSW